MNSAGNGMPLMGKLSIARWVWAPHNASAGMLTGPMLSCSVRNFWVVIEEITPRVSARDASLATFDEVEHLLQGGFCFGGLFEFRPDHLITLLFDQLTETTIK